MPPTEWKAMAGTAKKENRTMSALVRELYRRYMAGSARQEFGRAVETLRAEAAKTPAGKLSMRQIDAEIAADRRDRRRTKQPAG